MLLPTYGNLLRSFRKNRRQRLEEVAHSAGIDASYLSRLERDERGIPTLGVQQAIAIALKLSEDEKGLLERSKEADRKDRFRLDSLRKGEVIVMRMTAKDAAKIFGERISRQSVLLDITSKKETSM